MIKSANLQPHSVHLPLSETKPNQLAPPATWPHPIQHPPPPRFKNGYTLRSMALKSLIKVEGPQMDELAAYQQAGGSGSRDSHLVSVQVPRKRGVSACQHGASATG
jgi:hypothetical protein